MFGSLTHNHLFPTTLKYPLDCEGGGREHGRRLLGHNQSQANALTIKIITLIFSMPLIFQNDHLNTLAGTFPPLHPDRDESRKLDLFLALSGCHPGDRDLSINVRISFQTPEWIRLLSKLEPVLIWMQQQLFEQCALSTAIKATATTIQMYLCRDFWQMTNQLLAR